MQGMGNIMKQASAAGVDSNAKLKHYMTIMDSMTNEGMSCDSFPFPPARIHSHIHIHSHTHTHTCECTISHVEDIFCTDGGGGGEE